MKKIFIPFFTCFYCFIILVPNKLFSQEETESTCLQDNFCKLSLCDICAVPFSNIQQDLNISYGTYNTSLGYSGDVVYANENDGCTNPADNCVTSDNDILHFDVYYPADYTHYNACPLPAVVFVHGGGFSDCNPIDANSDECIDFAQRGFVVFNISYRIGRRVTPSASYPFFTVQQELATYRASQDVRGAIRSIIAMQGDGTFGTTMHPYQINTDWIFLAGASAGAITALNVAYYPTQTMEDAIYLHSGTYSISDALGLINANYYYGSPSIDYASKIKGVCDQWGSVSLPHAYDSTTASNFFTQRVPVICFHGQLDPVVPIYQTKINYAPIDMTLGYGSLYNTETSCIDKPSFQTDNSTTNSPDFTTYGSYSFFLNILQKLDIPSELYIDCQMHHGLDNDCTCSLTTTKDSHGNCVACTPFQSDFGTGYTNQADVTKYIVGRAAVFFQNIIGGNAQLRQDKTMPTLHKVFVECANYNTKCNLTNNDNGCSNTDKCGDH